MISATMQSMLSQSESLAAELLGDAARGTKRAIARLDTDKKDKFAEDKSGPGKAAAIGELDAAQKMHDDTLRSTLPAEESGTQDLIDDVTTINSRLKANSMNPEALYAIMDEILAASGVTKVTG